MLDRLKISPGVGRKHLVRRHVRQLDVGVVIRQDVQRVVEVHPLVGRVPLQDHLLKRLQREGSLKPTLADRIANGFGVELAHEIPHWHPAGVGHGKPVVWIGRVAARIGEQAASAKRRAYAVQRPQGGQRARKRQADRGGGSQAQAHTLPACEAASHRHHISVGHCLRSSYRSRPVRASVFARSS